VGVIILWSTYSDNIMVHFQAARTERERISRQLIFIYPWRMKE